MVIISEVISLTDLVNKATDLLLRLPDQWYKATLEIESFKSNLSILRQRIAQWNRQLKQFGMSEDPALKPFLDNAAKLLDEEDDYYEKHRKNRLWKLRRRLFPNKLTYILAEVIKIIEAGPGLVKAGVEAHEQLTKRLLMTPLPLPFGYDRKYVLLPGAVEEVQTALEDPEGPQVVTLYGEPGMGKSSLAKYVALLYQDSICGSGSSSFDGVQYLFCGQGSRSRLHQLRKDFLSNRGVELAEPAAIEGQEGNHQVFQSTLRRLFVDQKLLIILDDVWSEDLEVLVNLICPAANGIRYLVTSQTKRIWPDALNIEVSKPDDEHALQILINHTEGLSLDRQAHSLCTKVQTEIREITEKLENHPFSLVNVAVSMNRNEATDPNPWRVLAQNMYTHLDQNHYTGCILVNGRPYSRSVSASMMLMVESLLARERDLLFLVAMLKVDHVSYGMPESLVKYFFNRLNPENPSQSTYNYVFGIKYLEENSLVQVHRYPKGLTLGESVEINHARVRIHNLRRQYIRQKSSPALHSIASAILTQGDRDTRLVNVNVRDSDQCLATVLSTLYFDDSLRDVVALPFQRVMEHMSTGGVVSRGLEQKVGPDELVIRAKDTWSWFEFGRMIIVVVELLNLQGDEGWKQKARSDTTKIMMKLVCQKELEDESMASLLIMPQTMAAACEIFDCIYVWMYHLNLRHLFYFGQRRALSDTHPQTWRALSNLWYNNLWYKNLKFSEIPSRILKWMLEFEPESTLLAEVQRLCRFVDQSADPVLQRIVEDGFLRLHESRITSQMLSGLDLDLEYLLTILWKLIYDEDLLVSSGPQNMYERALKSVLRDKGYIQRLLSFPISCDRWLTDSSLFRRLLRLEERFGPFSLLGILSGTPHFGAKAAEILKEDCWGEDFLQWPESYGGRLARFWGNVALVKDLHHATRQRLVKIAQRWIARLTAGGKSSCFCSCSCSDDGCSCRPKCRQRYHYCPDQTCGDGWGILEVMRTLTIINRLHASSSMVIPTLKDFQQDCQARMGQVQACDEMGMYAEVKLYLDSAQQAFDLISSNSPQFNDVWEFHAVEVESRLHMVFMKATAKDYTSSMDLVTQYLKDYMTSNSLRTLLGPGNRAVMWRLAGMFSRAIRDFNRFLNISKHTSSSELVYETDDPRLHYFIQYCLSRQPRRIQNR